MEKIKIEVTNNTRSSKRPAELCTVSGIIKFDDGEYNHIISLKSRDAHICAVVASEPAPLVEEKKEVVALVSPVRRDRKKKSK